MVLSVEEGDNSMLEIGLIPFEIQELTFFKCLTHDLKEASGLLTESRNGGQQRKKEVNQNG